MDARVFVDTFSNVDDAARVSRCAAPDGAALTALLPNKLDASASLRALRR